MKPTLVVLAAGLGSRYGGVKQIDSVGKNGECLLDYAAYDCKRAGFDKIVYVIRRDIEKDFRSRLFDKVAKHMDASYVFQEHESLLSKKEIELSLKRKKPWGTIHALLCAREEINAPFSVINSDDYYGSEAFFTMGNYLSSIEKNSTMHAMIGYVLNKTMSPSGSVSRGVCKVENGELSSIQEHKQIYFDKDASNKKIISLAGEKKIELTGNECVSMNFFGFSLLAFDTFYSYWENFKKQSIESDTSEALLPAAVSEIILSKAGTVKVFMSKESWFGMTYPEDKILVKNQIASKIDSHYYPLHLWD